MTRVETNFPVNDVYRNRSVTMICRNRCVPVNDACRNKSVAVNDAYRNRSVTTICRIRSVLVNDARRNKSVPGSDECRNRFIRSETCVIFGAGVYELVPVPVAARSKA